MTSVLHLRITLKYQFSRQTVLTDCTLQVLSKQFEWQYWILFDNVTMSNLPTARMEVCMAYRLANHQTLHGSFEKLNVRKDWKQLLAKITTIFIGKSSVNFWITLRKFRDMSGNFNIMFFTNPWKSISLKIFVKISANFWKTFVTVGQGYDKLFTNEVSLYSTRIYKLFSFHTALASSGRLCERPRACKSAGTALTFGK